MVTERLVIDLEKKTVFEAPIMTNDKHSMSVCSRVSIVPAESIQWELCVELDKGVHMLGVSQSGNNYTVSEIVQNITSLVTSQ